MPILLFFIPLLHGAGLWLLKTILTGVVLRLAFTWVTFLGLEYMTAHMMGIMPGFMSPSAIRGYFTAVFNAVEGAGGSQILNFMWYFAEMSALPFGFATILNAHITRFLVRRIFK